MLLWRGGSRSAGQEAPRIESSARTGPSAWAGVMSALDGCVTSEQQD